MKMSVSGVVFLFLCVWTYVNCRIVLNHVFSFDRIRPKPPVGPEPIKPDRPVDPTKSPNSIQPRAFPALLDVVFIIDSTGSMSPYIENVRQNIRRFVDEITVSSTGDVQLALIEYRDHPPQDHTFVTRKHDFTSSVSIMKSWLDEASALGGGDKPEAVSDALYDATKLSWRQYAVKIGVLVADAPPHGLSPSEDRSFPQGSPNGHDPIELTNELWKNGVTMYTIGCEPSILPYKDFFMALAYVTGGQYIPLSHPQRLIEAIIGGTQEEMSLKSLANDVQQEIEKVKAAGGPFNEGQVVQTVFKKLSDAGVQTTHLLRNKQPLEEPSSTAKAMAAAKSMSEVRQMFVKTENAADTKPSVTSLSSFTSKFRTAMETARAGLPLGTISGEIALSPKIDLGGRIRGDIKAVAAVSAGVDSIGHDFAEAETMPFARGAPVFAGAGSGALESFSTVKSAVSLDQVSRLVKQEAAALLA